MRIFLFFTLLFGYLWEASAQYAPTTRWPYLYENFIPGTVLFSDGQKSELQLNVHLWGNVLHYISQDGRIFESTGEDIFRVEIGKDTYCLSSHKLFEIVEEQEQAMLVKLVRGDFDFMFTGTGAYGASLNSSSARDLSSIDLGGLNKPELGKMLQEKKDGSEIPLQTEYYFIINGKQIDANKKSVEEVIERERINSWKQFLKEKKIKWKKEDNLKIILNFLTTKG